MEQGSVSQRGQQSPGLWIGFSQVTGGHSKSQQSISPCYKNEILWYSVIQSNFISVMLKTKLNAKDKSK